MHRRVAALAVLLALGTAGTVHAQQNPFVGSWRGVVMLNGLSITLNLVMQADQHYSEQEVSRVGMTMQTGSYMVANGLLSMQVQDWQPKTQSVYHPTGTVGGYYSQENVAPPPGGTYRYQFTSPASFTIQDVNFGGAVTFNRVQ